MCNSDEEAIPGSCLDEVFQLWVLQIFTQTCAFSDLLLKRWKKESISKVKLTSVTYSAGKQLEIWEIRSYWYYNRHGNLKKVRMKELVNSWDMVAFWRLITSTCLGSFWMLSIDGDLVVPSSAGAMCWSLL